MNRKAFTLIELLVCVAIVGLLAMIVVGPVCGGSGGEQGGILVNPVHVSTAVIKVMKTYPMAAEGGNIYRVFCKVLEDSDGNTGEETMEIRDSFLDGNYLSADLFGKLIDGETYKVTCRGERSGVASAFRGITSVEPYDPEAVPETEGW